MSDNDSEPLRPIPITRPELDGREAAAVTRAVLSGWLSQGPEVVAFEQEFAAAVGAPHACAVSSGTAALHLALLAVGVAAGDEVVTVSHSFIATANAVRYCGATPVFVDIEPLPTYNLDSAQLESAIGKRTRAILVPHQLGMPANMAAILDLAQRHSLPVVEDAAASLGSQIRREEGWQRLGRPHGGIACFSFHPPSLISTGDGGMLTTANPDWHSQLRLLRHQGRGLSESVRHDANEPILESYPELGYNYRMTDLQAAVGRTQLERLADIVERRRRLARRYQDLLAQIEGLRLPHEPDWARSNWHSYCVGLPDDCDQRQVMQHMLDQGVATRRGVMCAHREPSYPPGSWRCPASLSRSEHAQDHSILVPFFQQMNDGEQVQVARALRHALRQARA